MFFDIRFVLLYIYFCLILFITSIKNTMKFSLFGYKFAFHKEGIPFIAISFFISLVLLVSSGFNGLSVLCFFVSFFVAGFFRDPERVTPSKDGLVVSPADGKVVGIQEVDVPENLSLEYTKAKKVSIFLSVFDVHVNRAPIAGKVVSIKYVPGKFINASTDKSSEHNERNYLSIQTESGTMIGCSQIAGLVARRIVCHVQEGYFLATGERFGIIKFGSRVELYLPVSSEIKTSVGQYLIGGETVISSIN